MALRRSAVAAERFVAYGLSFLIAAFLREPGASLEPWLAMSAAECSKGAHLE